MKSKPVAGLPEAIGAGALGRMLDVSAQFLGNLLRDGHIHRAAQHGHYQLEASVRGYVHFLRENRKTTSKTAAAQRLQEARADEVQLRVAERQRELIPIDDAEAALDFVLASVRSELSGISARVTRDVPLRRQIEREINESMDRMAAALDSASQSARTGGDVSEAGADPDAGRVGEAEPVISSVKRAAGSARAAADTVHSPDHPRGRQRRLQAGRDRDGVATGEN